MSPLLVPEPWPKNNKEEESWAKEDNQDDDEPSAEEDDHGDDKPSAKEEGKLWADKEEGEDDEP